jgi:hypothetical protein
VSERSKRTSDTAPPIAAIAVSTNQNQNQCHEDGNGTKMKIVSG